MDRIIEVKVSGNYLSKDNKNAGVRGEANVTKLRITFDEGWLKDDYSKKITFWNARGLNPVVVDLVPTFAETDKTYLVPIPKEPLEEAGNLTFVIDGEIEGKVQRSVSDTLEVKDAPIAENAGQPIPPTPDELTQLRISFEGIKEDVLDAVKARDEAKSYRNNTQEFSQIAKENAQKAMQSALEAEESVGKTSYIGENGNWFEWNNETKSFYDTGIKAQAGSTVYLGDNPPDEAGVWIDPNSDNEIEKLIKDYIDTVVNALFAKSLVKTATISLPASEWIENSEKQYSQVVLIDGITEYSKVDLQPTTEQLLIFHEKDITFVAENDDGVITIYCIGQKPMNDYTMQATITEVEIDG